MKIKVTENVFVSIEDLRGKLTDRGYFIQEIPFPELTNKPHWHSFDSSLYILEGEVKITDVNEGVTLLATPGCRVDFPPEVIHFESTKGYKVLAEMSEKPEDLLKVNLDPDLLC